MRLPSHFHLSRRTQLVSEQLVLIAAFAGLAVVLLASAMTANLDYDEEQYVAGAYFARGLSVYRDFISFQPPPYTWILAAVYDAVSGWYLLAARVVTWVFALGSCMLLFSLLLAFGTGRIGAFVLVLGFVTSPFALGPLALTRNDIMPLFFVLAGLRFCLGPGGELTPSAPRTMASGFFLALSAATKYSYVFAAPVVAAALLYDEYIRRDPNRAFSASRAGSFVVGATVGILPLLYSLAVHQDRFVFLTLEFHLTAVYDWYRVQGYGELLTLQHKMKSLPRQLLRHGNATILFIFVCFVFAAAFKKSRNPRHLFRWSPGVIALVGLFCGALIFATFVGPHAMYFAPVTALGALLAGRVYAMATPEIPRALTAMLLIVSLVPAAPALLRYGRQLIRSTDLAEWTGIQTHRSAVRIARILAQHGVSGHVATLFPTIVMDVNRVLPEFAAGPFFFRSADTYPAERVAQLHGVGPTTLENLFAVSPPAAIVGRFSSFRFKWNPPLDAALIDYARRSGFVRVADDWAINGYRYGEVWVRPGTP